MFGHVIFTFFFKLQKSLSFFGFRNSKSIIFPSPLKSSSKFKKIQCSKIFLTFSSLWIFFLFLRKIRRKKKNFKNNKRKIFQTAVFLDIFKIFHENAIFYFQFFFSRIFEKIKFFQILQTKKEASKKCQLFYIQI